MRKNISLAASFLVLVMAGLSCLKEANAVIIEGVTPSGKFKSVFVTEAGRLPVETTTGTAQHVIVDSGTITAFQGTKPWAVSTAVGVAVTVKSSTSSVVATSQFAVTGVASNCYPTDALRSQGVVCNADANINIYIGDGGVGVGSGAILQPGSCLSPDVPSSFIGSLFCISTAPVSGFYIYFK